MDRLSFSYDNCKQIFSNISFTIEKNHVVGIYGPNGSGKTTLVKLLLGILKPQSGAVFMEERNTSELYLAQIGKKVGVVLQNPERQLFTPTVYEEAAFSLKYRGLSKVEIDEKVNRWLDFFELGNLKEQFPLKLSRGEKQRLVIAGIMIRGGEFFILDEPTTGLDRERIEKLSECLNNLRNRNIGYIIISHDKEFLRKHVDRYMILGDGGVRMNERI